MNKANDNPPLISLEQKLPIIKCPKTSKGSHNIRFIGYLFKKNSRERRDGQIITKKYTAHAWAMTKPPLKFQVDRSMWSLVIVGERRAPNLAN